ncbi:hypothetical protein Sango_1580100 [Sesamum angolense]|uniref:Uncharacterized protein n=1 Tax=Sesamum angolense TaxID=2727404 RepID=A0AAE1WQ16_9LAMI|nr:hypothetical protein Sango_1580100 [Sesamum angolense]
MVKFWSNKTTKYHPSPPHKEKKTGKSIHNPLGDIAIHERWSTAEDALFAKLCIERSLREEVYLAVFLACRFCVFVLLGKDVNSIRPSTFKMASLMANGQRVNLAIPVVASIYEGLNTVATSPKPTELRGSKMTRFSGEGDGPFKFVDDGHAEELDHNYFIAIRSSYLTLRQDGRFIIEPYSPYRFGRQFGCGGKSSKGKVSSHNVADSHSSNKDRHWKMQKKELTPLKAIEANENASRSSLANFIAELEDEVQSIDLKEAKARLQDVQAKISEEASEGKKQLNHDAQAKVHEVEKDITTLESTDPLDDAIVENLKILKEDLKSLNPFA